MATIAWSGLNITQASFSGAKSFGQTAHCMRFVAVLLSQLCGSVSDECKPNNRWPQAE